MRLQVLRSKALLLALGLFTLAVPAMAAELHAYVGAGLRPPIDALIAAFEKDSGIAVRAEYGGSGQLLARFDETGTGDLFIPGTTFYTDKLKERGAVADLKVLVVHGPVLAVTPGKAGVIQSFADLAKPGLRLGLGDPRAMALGRTAEEILDKSGQGEAIRKNVTVRAATVKQLALYLLDSNVDAAIIGASEIAQNPGALAVRSIPSDWYQAEYAPVAVLTTSRAPDAARRFADYLASAAGLAVFERFGFPAAPQDVTPGAPKP
ncbi:molybdate ABC transporter substrate-binding protein [Azospirillum agricola]|uniref:molybdate ABC transporter substrate-binding protein n=1 Tax=Azospirillum agricola TaxID=1720247 RepID=UPI000A0F233C|nr:molybdate ABC transporter substrate-binding protein [Azospirillum agricola]SMH29831.1 molybdate transport system substrate-binding protein [Azospirillum lipoferum]